MEGLFPKRRRSCTGFRWFLEARMFLLHDRDREDVFWVQACVFYAGGGGGGRWWAESVGGSEEGGCGRGWVGRGNLSAEWEDEDLTERWRRVQFIRGLSISAFVADRWNPRGASVTASAAPPPLVQETPPGGRGQSIRHPGSSLGRSGSPASHSQPRLKLYCAQKAGRKSC